MNICSFNYVFAKSIFRTYNNHFVHIIHYSVFISDRYSAIENVHHPRRIVCILRSLGDGLVIAPAGSVRSHGTCEAASVGGQKAKPTWRAGANDYTTSRRNQQEAGVPEKVRDP